MMEKIRRKTRRLKGGRGRISVERHVRGRHMKKVVIALFCLAAVLVLVLVALVLYDFGFFDGGNGPQYFEIKDECGLILGNLVHQVRDAGECRIKCVNECDVRDLEFLNFSFVGKLDDCNSCDCWCED